MDYGKLAYINLNDVNKRLQNLEKSNKSTINTYTHTKTLNHKINEFYSYDLRFGANQGDISLIGKIKLKNLNSARTQITIKINDLVCYFDSITGEGVQDYLIFASAQTQSGNNILKIEIFGQDYQGEILNVDLYFLGDSLKGFEPDTCLQLVNRPPQSLVASLIGDQIICFVSNNNTFDFDTPPIVLGKGISFALCQGYKNTQKTALAYIDAQRNLFFKTLDGFAIPIDHNVLSVALMPVDLGYLIAYIQDNKAYFKYVFWGTQASSRYEINTSIRLPETITAVNDAPKPILLIKTSDQKIYLKTSNTNISFEEGLLGLSVVCTPSP